MNAPINLRHATTKLAFNVPGLRPYLIPLLTRPVVAKEFSTERALKKYLEEHPNADRSQHSVKKIDKPKGGKPEAPKDDKDTSKEKPKGEARKKPPMRPTGWSEKDDAGNMFWGEHSQILGDKATVKDSKLGGIISGNAKVTKSSTSVGSEIGGNADISGSTIEGLVEVNGNAKLTNANVDAHNITITGDTEISNASIEGGNWKGQKVTGGRWKDSYDQDVIDILEKKNDPKYPKRAGTGDGPVWALTLWIADGGRLKGLLGGKKSRKKVQKALEGHLSYAYSGNKQAHAREGAKALEKFSDDEFDILMKAAEAKADKRKSRRKKGTDLRLQLIRLASANPEVRKYVVPLLRAAGPAKSPVEKAKKKGEWNLVLYKSRATRWDYSMENPEGGSSGSSSYPTQKGAIAAGTRVRDWRGKTKYHLIIAQWDPNLGDFKVMKTEWREVPQEKTAAEKRLRRGLIRVAFAYPEHRQKILSLVQPQRSKTGHRPESALEKAVWNAWGYLEGNEKIRKGWVELVGRLGLEISVSEAADEDPQLYKLGERIERASRSIERQSRSWRTAYNLLREEKIELDGLRLAGDLTKTLQAMQRSYKSLLQLQRKVPNDLAPDLQRATAHHLATERAFEEAIKLAKRA